MPLMSDKKRACVIRLGAIGDLIIISPVLQELKNEGYEVTLICKSKAQWIFHNSGLVDNYHIWTDADEKEIHDQAAADPKLNLFDLAVNKCLLWATGFDRVVNLCGVIEGPCLRKVYDFSDEFLKSIPTGKELYEKFGHGNTSWKMPQVNHYDVNMFAAGYIGTGYKGRKPIWKCTADERHWAYKLIRKTFSSSNFRIVYQLSGSGIAKTYPFAAELSTLIHEAMPKAKIFTIGVGMEEMLEWGWAEEQPWVVPMACKSHTVLADGSYDIPPRGIRLTAALINASDVYIGPDTSFLHVAGAFDHVAKIPLFTMTTHETISKYYVNTYPIQSPAECSPCGKITSDCKRGPNGAAYCMELIQPQTIVNTIEEAYRKWDSQADHAKTKHKDQLTPCQATQ